MIRAPAMCSATDGEVESGLAAAFRQLRSLGIGPGLVAVLGAGRHEVDAAGGGRALVVSWPDLEALLATRRRGRELGRVPGIDEDPQWTIVFDGFPRTRADAATVESMTTLANGEIGVRGVFEDDGEGTPMVVAPGVFDERGDTPTLLAGPNWTSLVMLPESDADDRRVLDLRTGMLLRERRPRRVASTPARSGWSGRFGSCRSSRDRAASSSRRVPRVPWRPG